MKKHNVFRKIGENVSLQFRKVPLYPKCIAFHNNIVVASNVQFMTHDAIHLVLNRFLGGKPVQEYIGCIEVMDNCFIGANSLILPNTKIGPNSVIAAGSFVNKDIPAGEVWGGVPARYIGTFDDLLRKRLTREKIETMQPSNQEISEELTEILWSRFYEMHRS